MVQTPPDGCSHPEPIAVPIPEAARLISLSVRKVHYLVADGTLPSVRVGRRRLIRTDDLHQFLDSHRDTPEVA